MRESRTYGSVRGYKVIYISTRYYGYTYSKGVEDECFKNPNMCRTYSDNGVNSLANSNNHPETGWIYNCNDLDDKIDDMYYWLISPDSYYSDLVFGLNYDGIISESSYYDGIAFAYIRPTVYLKSSINIISGEGTEQDPYVLG